MHIARLRVIATPDLAAGTASIDITAYAANGSGELVPAVLNFQLQDGPAVTATLSEKQWRIIRFALERAGESI